MWNSTCMWNFINNMYGELGVFLFAVVVMSTLKQTMVIIIGLNKSENYM